MLRLASIRNTNKERDTAEISNADPNVDVIADVAENQNMPDQLMMVPADPELTSPKLNAMNATLGATLVFENSFIQPKV